jgi:hypothetical protein
VTHQTDWTPPVNAVADFLQLQNPGLMSPLSPQIRSKLDSQNALFRPNSRGEGSLFSKKISATVLTAGINARTHERKSFTP